jgi:hypothetical protein
MRNQKLKISPLYLKKKYNIYFFIKINTIKISKNKLKKNK